MHPFALYLAATDYDRNRSTADRHRRPQFAHADAPPLSEPTPVSRLERLMAIVRRRVARATSA